MTTEKPSKPRVHHLVQAPVKPLDEDGVLAGVSGTIVWLVITIFLGLNLNILETNGHTWWFWTGVVGTSLGIIGTIYVWNRGRKR
ncbi:MAG: DUF2530 domain-containing protein [Propionibacterium sp.]|nr:MAG: DUF2530 domain-containing protein [Propionibacterium sp.]